jgi:hypothetical protein
MDVYLALAWDNYYPSAADGNILGIFATEAAAQDCINAAQERKMDRVVYYFDHYTVIRWEVMP